MNNKETMISSVASLLADPTRAAMLSALMDGRAYTATELALAGSVAFSTASDHLFLLRAGGLISLLPQGRYRYFRIASPEIAELIESLMGFHAQNASCKLKVGPPTQALRVARTCYDHLAGQLAVGFLDRCLQKHLVAEEQGVLLLTGSGQAWCDRLGIDVQSLMRARRPLCHSCLDWSERLPHLGGSLGAALLDRLFRLRLAEKQPGSRCVAISERGLRFLVELE
jgi:DNA-binding transcriptional ArsR family regulator